MFHRKIKRQIIHYGRGEPGDAKKPWIQAQILKDQGQYLEAAAIFERLAQAAQKRGMGARMPRLLLDAAHCRLLTGDRSHGYPLLRQALHLLHAQRKWKALQRTGEFAVAELERLGHPEAADETRLWLAQVLPAQPQPPDVAAEEASPLPKGFRLPSKCPSCGASLRSDEADWIDENNVECPYCGSTVPLRAA